MKPPRSVPVCPPSNFLVNEAPDDLSALILCARFFDDHGRVILRSSDVIRR
jgi:hypothetical protein